MEFYFDWHFCFFYDRLSDSNIKLLFLNRDSDAINFSIMERPDFDKIFMELAINIARRSHCVKRHVGAVLTKETRIISIGYNGPPAGTHNCDEEWPETGCERDSRGSCSLALHAEQNALMYAFRNSANVDGSTIYLTLTPCLACARMLLSAGIKKVIYLKSYAEYKGLPNDEGIEFLEKFGVNTAKFEEEVLVPDGLI